MTQATGNVASGWRQALPALLLLIAAILFFHRETALAMVEIWRRSETFTHAFLVPPISLWLIWRQRHALAALEPRPSFWLLALLALAGFGWLLGDLAAVNAVTQLALVALLVLAVPAVLGVRLGWAMAFPLAYLFFAVPIGEFVMPKLMDWTADFTIGALQLTGIPVVREGLHFTIPSGSWSVVEACSGVRYLIASVVVGTLFAYLNYRSMKRRLIFIVVSFLVPIVANWLRAYMIVMIGHLSDNKLAVGVDHLIYGWVFFGVVMLIMFMIGARWSEHPEAAECAVGLPQQNASAPASAPRMWIAAMLATVVILLPHAWLNAIEESEASRAGVPPSLTFAPPAGWQEADARQMNWRPAFDNARTETQIEFVQGERRVGVFVAYYRQQDYGHKLISSENVLVRTTSRDWVRVASGKRPVAVGGQTLDARTAELRGTAGERLTAWQWYWIGGRPTTSDHLAKVWQAFDRLVGRGDDSAVIVLYAAKEQEAALADFAAVAGPMIEQALRAASGR